MLYFYAPIFTQDEQLSPGQMVDGAVVFYDTVTPMKAPVCDRGDAQRFVLAVASEDFNAPDGWEPKTLAEVRADYPGVM
jgi:hypothetical protein